MVHNLPSSFRPPMEAVHNSAKKGRIEFDPSVIQYTSYRGERDLTLLMGIIDEELSEPYSIFTYRYFVHTWPNLTFLAFHHGKCVGTVVCKKEPHREKMRGYIAMLVVLATYRGKRIATELVTRAIIEMSKSGCQEVALEAEVTNKGALALYDRLGFIRAKRLHRYYLNGVDAFRLNLLFPAKKEGEASGTGAAVESSASCMGEASGTTEYSDVVSTSLPVSTSSDAAAQSPASGVSEASGITQYAYAAFTTPASTSSAAAAAQSEASGTSNDDVAQVPASGASNASGNL